MVGDLFSKPLSQVPDLHGLLTGCLGLPESGYDKPIFLGQRSTRHRRRHTGDAAVRRRVQANGQPVQLHTYPEDHSGTVNTSRRDSVPFVSALFG